MQLEFPVPAASATAEIISFPQSAAAKWRLEMAQCRTYEQALTIIFRMIREIEEIEEFPHPDQLPYEAHQLAFPWARAD